MVTSYLKLSKGTERLLAIIETEDGRYETTLTFLELQVDGWVVDKSMHLATSLKDHPAIVPQYAI